MKDKECNSIKNIRTEMRRMDDFLQELLKINKEERAFFQQGKCDINKGDYTSQQEFVIESSKFLKNNSLIISRKHPRFISFPTHKHDYIELNYVYNGKLKQTVGDNQITLEKGELLFLNQHIEHSLEKCNEEDIIINIIIHPSFFDYIIRELDSEENESSIVTFLFQSLFDQKKNGSYLYFKVAEVKGIQKLLEKIIEEMMSENVLNNLKMKFNMGLLLVELMNHANLLESQEVDYDYKLMNTVIKYINDNYSKASLKELSDEMKIESYNLSKFIKVNFGNTFKQLVQEKRITEAKKLLKYEDFTVDEVAHEIGYENISYFYKLFKKITGFTPDEFRKN